MAAELPLYIKRAPFGTSENVLARFESELKTTQDTREMRHLLLVLGNAGSQQAVSTVLPFTEHSDPLIRANAPGHRTTCGYLEASGCGDDFIVLTESICR